GDQGRARQQTPPVLNRWQREGGPGQRRPQGAQASVREQQTVLVVRQHACFPPQLPWAWATTACDSRTWWRATKTFERAPGMVKVSLCPLLNDRTYVACQATKARTSYPPWSTCWSELTRYVWRTVDGLLMS